MNEISFGLRRLLDREGATCSVCDGLRIVLPNLPAGHPDYYTPIPCPVCTDPAELVARRWRALEQKFGAYWMMDSRKLRQFALQDFVGLPDDLETGKTDALYAATTWANSQSLTYEHIEQAAPTTGSFEPSTALVIGGPSGMGKTCLAAAAFMHRLADGVGLALEYNQLVRVIQSGYSDHTADDILNDLQRIPLLFIDDLGNVGQSVETENKRRLMFQLVDYRQSRQLPTIITTNLTHAEMIEAFDQKTADRLREWAVWVVMGGRSLRLKEGLE